MAIFDFLQDIDLSTLSRALKDELVKQGAYAGLKAGQTLTQTRIDLRNNGLSFGNDIFSGYWQQARESSIGFQHVTEIGLEDDINIRNLPSSNLLTKNFGAIVEYDILDEEGNLIGVKTSRVDVDKLTTPSELLQASKEFVTKNYPIAGIQLDSMRLLGALRQR